MPSHQTGERPIQQKTVTSVSDIRQYSHQSICAFYPSIRDPIKKDQPFYLCCSSTYKAWMNPYTVWRYRKGSVAVDPSSWARDSEDEVRSEERRVGKERRGRRRRDHE